MLGATAINCEPHLAAIRFRTRRVNVGLFGSSLPYNAPLNWQPNPFSVSTGHYAIFQSIAVACRNAPNSPTGPLRAHRCRDCNVWLVPRLHRHRRSNNRPYATQPGAELRSYSPLWRSSAKTCRSFTCRNDIDETAVCTVAEHSPARTPLHTPAAPAITIRPDSISPVPAVTAPWHPRPTSAFVDGSSTLPDNATSLNFASQTAGRTGFRRYIVRELIGVNKAPELLPLVLKTGTQPPMPAVKYRWRR